MKVSILHLYISIKPVASCITGAAWGQDGVFSTDTNGNMNTTILRKENTDTKADTINLSVKKNNYIITTKYLG